MSGLILLFVALVWLIASLLIAAPIARLLPSTGWRVTIGTLLFCVLVPLPLIDEIVGARQFERLCKEHSTIHVDRAKATGRTVYLADTPSVDLENTWIRITLQPWRYIDVKTGETVMSYNVLVAGRRHFLTGLGPLTFRGYCAPGGGSDPFKLLKEIGVTRIDRSALEGEARK